MELIVIIATIAVLFFVIMIAFKVIDAATYAWSNHQLLKAICKKLEIPEDEIKKFIRD